MSEALPLVESEDLVLVRDSARGLLQDAWPASRAVADAIAAEWEAQRERIEATTDRLAVAPWAAIGADAGSESRTAPEG